jgi:tRNA-specific 2-thiouridylase
MARGRAVALLSGGLDSRLAVKLMLEQEIEVLGVNFVTPFCTCTAQGCRSEAREAAGQLGIPLKVVNNSDGLLKAVKNPRFGHGRGLNPCLDCRVLGFERAAEYMREVEATFLVTGEVLGQRPMSQRRRAMEMIEREAGLEGRVVRPLSARHMPPTEPEREGVIDRSRLLGLTGRSRRPQMDLAEDLGINDYPCPAGGCLLTDRTFAARLAALLEEFPDASMPQVTLLKAGRHFRSSVGQWMIVPREDLENRRLFNLRNALSAVVEAVDVGGPQGGIMTRGKPADATIHEAAALVARYGQGRDREAVAVRAQAPDGSWELLVEVSPVEGAALADSLEKVGEGRRLVREGGRAGVWTTGC